MRNSPPLPRPLRLALAAAALLALGAAGAVAAGRAWPGPFLAPGASYYTPGTPALIDANGNIISGPSGVSGTGTSCTITAISQGIITAATCS